MPEWSPRFMSQPLTANDIGRQGMSMMQPRLTPLQQPRFMTTTTPGRPFSDVGKMSLNFGNNVGQMGKNIEQTAGFVEGIGAGIGGLLGGVFGPDAAKAGTQIGGSIGRIAQAPIDIAAGVLGNLPGPGAIGSLGRLASMDDAQRAEVMKGWDGNPLSVLRYMGDLDKQDWTRKIDNGEVSALFSELGSTATLGDTVMGALGLLGLPSNLVQRAWAGGPGEAIDRIVQTPDADLSEQVRDLKAQLQAGTISQDEFLDQIVLNNAGYTNEWGSNLLLSMVADPLLILSGGAGAAAKAAVGAKMTKAQKFVGMIGDEAYATLSKRVEAAAGDLGIPLKGDINSLILDEAKKMGLHDDAIAEASKQMSARQRWLVEYAEPLTPVFKTAQKIADPIQMIGRRGSQPLVNAWLTAKATEGVANAYGIGNFRAVQARLARLGVRDRFDTAMGHFTAQEGQFMQGELLSQDVAAVRRAGMARPTDIGLARSKVGQQTYDRQIEAHVGRRKVDVAQPTGLGTAEEALARAQDDAVAKLVKMTDISGDEARAVLDGLDADALSMIDAAYFGHKIKVYNTVMRTARERLASVVDGLDRSGKRKGAREAKQLDAMKRYTLIGPRELTSGRAKTLRALLEDDAAPTATKAEAARAAARRYDRLGSTVLADGPTDQEVIGDVLGWLDNHGKELTDEVADTTALPDELRAMLDPEDGYIFGMRPDDGIAEWRLKYDPETNEIVSSNPWIDIVSDDAMAQPWNTRFNGDTKIGSMMNALERAVGSMSHTITTERIFNEARRDFITKGMNGYMPSQTSALTYTTATGLWKAVLDKATELGTTPRGMSLREFQDIIAKTPGAVDAGISARDLMGMTLHSFEGRLGTVGVTQKFTGQIKTSMADITGNNTLGQMAERMYPMVRFSMNPFFQLQEWVEPWVFSAARGRKATLSGGWLDAVTGERVEPDELMRRQQNLIDRYRATNPYAHFDMMERSMVYLYGQKAAKDASKMIHPGKLERARQMLAQTKTTADRKAVAQSEMFRYFLGPTLKQQFDSIDPLVWADLERQFGTKDMGTIAMRWLTEKDAWAALDPQVASHLTDAAKVRHIGRAAPVDLDSIAKHTFKTPRKAMTMSVADGTMTRDAFSQGLRDVGADEEYINRSWKALQWDVKTGGVDAYWDQLTTGPAGRPKIEVAKARALMQVLADTKGVSEVEFLSTGLNAHALTLMHDDLIAALDSDLQGYDALFQTAEDARYYFETDEITGQRVPRPYDEAEARAKFLSRSTVPPSDLPPEHWGAYDDMVGVRFGLYGREVFTPGGLKALADVETPWTVWESHLIRSQLVNPNDLADPVLKHAMYEKLWRAHTIDMADPDSAFRVFNNAIMAMTSPQMNLTKNELIASRLRVGSMDDLRELRTTAAALRQQIADAYPEGADIPPGDLGLAYSTAEDIAHYIPLDNVEKYGRSAYRAAEGDTIRRRGRVASDYLDQSKHAQHTKIAKDNPERDVGRITEWAIDEVATVIGKQGIDGLRSVRPEFGVRLKVVTGAAEDQIRYTDAAAKLAEDPFDVAARDVIGELVSTKALDDTIVWKPWNVNGAGAPYAKAPDGRVSGHGQHKLFGYIKNDDVAWRNIGTNAAIGNALRMAEDMVDNPVHYARRQTALDLPEPARFGTDARGNATVPTQFKSEPGFVYRTVNQSRTASNWRVGEYVARHPATIYAEGDSSVVLRVRQDVTGWDEAVGGVDASQNLQAREVVTAGQVEMLTADGSWVPVVAQEPLDEFAERIAHRTRGLSLKTGYFGVDLGDPMAFNRGVMDIHMVGELTEHMYYDLTNKGTDPRWAEWLGSLSPEKQKLIGEWLERDYVMVDIKDAAGRPTGKTKRVPYPDKAPRGAGAFKWAEAGGLPISFQPGAGVKASLDVAKRDGDTAQLAAYVRGQIDAAVANPKSKITQAEADRMYRMYRNDAELAELYGRKVDVFGGDYAIYDDLMTEHKASAAVSDPTLARHGNGGYQWKLWDDRRNIYDPEVVTYKASHTLPRRSVKMVAASDDAHFAAGFMDDGGLRPVQEAGYRFLDPHTTAMYQRSGADIRGATIFADRSDAIIAITEKANASTLVHELTHALLEPMLDESGRRVVLDDMGEFIARQNADTIRLGDEAKATVDTLADEVRTMEGTLATTEGEAKRAATEARAKVQNAQTADKRIGTLQTSLTKADTELKTLNKNAAVRRRDIEALGLPPSRRATRLAAVDNQIARAQKKVDTLTTQLSEQQAKVGGLWDEANQAQDAATSLADDATYIRSNLTERRKEGDLAKAEYDRLATTPPRGAKDVWDDEVSEHFAQQYEVWLRTGKASNPKMRDAMAYFHRVLSKLRDWLHANPDVKVSPAMQDLFDRMHAGQRFAGPDMANAVPFDASQEMFHAAGRESVVAAEDAAHTNVQFRRGRSLGERSLNHPYFGIYPFSYMWGKVAPEMVRALALNPFGLPIPGMLQGATPGLGFLNAQRAWTAVEMQKANDTEFREMMDDPQNAKMYRSLGMFLPAVPWDIPANFPLWSRRVAEQGLTDQERIKQGEEPRGLDIAATAHDVLSYSYGPAATLDWMGDVAKFPKAPVFGEEDGGVGDLSASNLVVGAEGAVPLEEHLRRAQGQLGQQLGE